MSLKSTLIGALVATAFALPALADIEIHDQYARSSNAMSGAAFLVIYNHGDTDDHLLSVTSDAAARTELHTHIENADGVMQMIHVDEGFDIPAGGEITLRRGGNHVMFMGLSDPFEQDATVTITFTFENAGDIIVEIPVDQTREDQGTMGMDHADHGDANRDMDHSDHASDG